MFYAADNTDNTVIQGGPTHPCNPRCPWLVLAVLSVARVGCVVRGWHSVALFGQIGLTRQSVDPPCLFPFERR